MDRENIYEYFILQADLWQAVINWLRKKVENTEYQSAPYRINKVCLIDGGCISLSIAFLMDGIEVNESYRLSVKELENV